MFGCAPGALSWQYVCSVGARVRVGWQLHTWIVLGCMLSPIQHAILFKTRRALAAALAISDEFAKQTGLDSLRKKNAFSFIVFPFFCL